MPMIKTTTRSSMSVKPPSSLRIRSSIWGWSSWTLFGLCSAPFAPSSVLGHLVATRLPHLLEARGFASHPRGWFALGHLGRCYGTGQLSGRPPSRCNEQSQRWTHVRSAFVRYQPAPDVPITRHMHAREEDGWVLVTALVLMLIMAVFAAATLTLSSGEARSSAASRSRESAFNLAEAAMNAQTFALASHWPGTGGATSAAIRYPTSCTPSLADSRCPDIASMRQLATSVDTIRGSSWS